MAPGTNVGAKAGLNRVILHTGWAAMQQMLEYKAVELVQIPAAYTSLTCSACGAVDADSRRSQTSFQCVACGHAKNADLNAAPQHFGVGDWRLCTARGVHVGDPGDP